MVSAKRICLTPRTHGVGGMVSFQHKLAAGLNQRGFEVCFDLQDRPYDAVLVIGGTRRLAALWQAGNQGIPIIQRLNGMNWLHRMGKTGGAQGSGLRHYMRAEYGNLLLSFIRARLARRVVYQSEFAKAWWNRVYGPTRVQDHVIYNGVDLEAYSPGRPSERPAEHIRLLLVEGSFMGGYDLGLEVAIQLAERLTTLSSPAITNQVELMIVGKAPPSTQAKWASRTEISLTWVGQVPREQIPTIDRSAHLLYSADINAACPNSVIEALACGLPVVSFDTGALPELVADKAGRIAAYGGDPWRLDPPDVPALVCAAQEVLDEQESFQYGARARAETLFSLDHMVEQYLNVLME